MFCEECKSLLMEGDKFCRVCGAEVSKAVDTAENDRKPNTADHAASQTEVGGFDIPADSNKPVADDNQFKWDLDGFPKPRKTEDVDFNWNTGGDPASGHSKDLTEKLDKYFSFDKANEDFQKLLDKEYEKIREYSGPLDKQPDIERINLAERIGLTQESTDASEPESKTGDNAGSDGETDAREFFEEIIEIKEGIAEGDADDEEEPEVIWVGRMEEETEKEGEKEKEESEKSEQESEKAEEEPEKTEEEPEKSEEEPETPLWFETEKEGEEEVKKGMSPGRAILIVIIIILLAVVAILGVQYFAPDSRAAQKAGEISGIVSETLTEWKDNAMEFFEGIGGNEEGDSQSPANPPEKNDRETELPGDSGKEPEDAQGEEQTPDTVPAQDKDALVAAAAAERNKNIDAVKANDELTWQKDRKYAITDIENSRPIENNHWATDPNGAHVYYDQEIAATLIDFDSKWVDYINNGDKAVIDLTKKGSKARKNAETFSKVGKVKQTFLLLEIGEIRQGQDAFYAWTYEEIKEVKGSAETVKKYNWIYCLEPVEGQMKIVNYYKY